MKKALLAIATIVLIALAPSCKNEMFLAKKLEKLPTNVITPADLRKNYNIETTAVEKLYPSGLESFGDTIPQAYLDEWTRFLMDMGKALEKAGLEREKDYRLWLRGHYSADGSVEYFFYNFLGQDLPSPEWEAQFREVVKEYIKTFRFNYPINRKFSQCGSAVLESTKPKEK